jgi:hypothetical protein
VILLVEGVSVLVEAASRVWGEVNVDEATVSIELEGVIYLPISDDASYSASEVNVHENTPSPGHWILTLSFFALVDPSALLVRQTVNPKANDSDSDSAQKKNVTKTTSIDYPVEASSPPSFHPLPHYPSCRSRHLNSVTNK